VFLVFLVFLVFPSVPSFFIPSENEGSLQSPEMLAGHKFFAQHDAKNIVPLPNPPCLTQQYDIFFTHWLRGCWGGTLNCRFFIF
jgi:hypothetical protein